MAQLTFIEKNKLEKLFNMKSGYVLDFSDRSFQEFVKDSTGKNIYDSKYEYSSGSKANRLRAFWSLEANFIVGKLTRDLLAYLADDQPDVAETALFKGCLAIVENLTVQKAKGGKAVSVESSREELSVARSTDGSDPRIVFVVHGRNADARKELFRFLRSIGLNPLEWSQAVDFTDKGAPYIGEILDAAFTHAQAVIVLMTPDDEARLRIPYRRVGDPDYERSLTGQSRPNVLFEAGMAMGYHPARTILIEIGELRPFSDIGGRHVVRLSNSVAARQNIATRLRKAGCSVDLRGTDWHTEGDFDSVVGEASSEEREGEEVGHVDVNAIFARLSHLAVYKDFYLHYELPRSSLANAQARFLPDGEDVMAFLDNTEADSGRNGVGFTNTGLYWRNNHTEEAQKLTWESLADKFIVGSDRDDEVRMDSEIINLSNSTVPASELAEALRDIASILTT